MADRNVKVTVRADVGDFKRGMDDAARSTEKVGTAAEQVGKRSKGGLSGMADSIRQNGDAWSTIGTGLTAYGIAVTGITALVAKTGIEYNTLRQTSTAALDTMLGGAKAAADQMDRLDDFATNSPFARQVFIQAQQQMLGFGVEAEKVIPALDAIQNAVAAMGGSNEQIAALAEIMARIKSEGRLSGDALQRMGYYGIDAAAMIGEQMGMTALEIREMAARPGGIPVDQIWDPLVNGMQAKFGGAADNVKETFAGAIDRVRAAFRDLSSDAMAVFVDPTGGGLAVDGLNRLADALRAFEDMPSGLRNTALGIGALSGAASLAAGGFFLLAPRLVETYDALERMGVDMPAVTGKLKGMAGVVAKGGALVIGLAALATAMQNVEQTTWNAAPGVEEVTAALLDMQDVGNQGQIDDLIANMEILGNGTVIRSAPIDSLADAIQRLDNPTALQRMENLDSILPGVQTSGDRAAEALGAIDSALVGMVQAGDAAAAMAALDAALEGTGVSAEVAMQYLPGFKDALIGVENEARAAGGATDGLADSMIALPEGMPTKLDRMRDAGAELATSISDAAGAFVDLSTDIDNAEVSLDKWLDQLLEQAAARDKWVENMRTLAKAGLEDGFYAALIEQGDAGALRVQQMVDDLASGRDVSEFNAMGRELGLAGVEGVAAEIAEAEFPTMELEAALDRQAFLEDANAAVTLTEEQMEIIRAKAELDMDDQAARLQTAETILWAAEQTGIMNLDANDVDAIYAIDNWNGIAQNTTGVTQLDSDPALALGEVAALVQTARMTVATANLDANPRPANSVAEGWASWVRTLAPAAGVAADASSAYGTVDALVWNIGNRTATLNVVTRLAGGLNMGGSARHLQSVRAAGGVERKPMMAGPGYGASNMILWGEPETRGEAFISNHPNYKRENLSYLNTAAGWFGKMVVDKYAAGGIPQRMASPAMAYAGGGATRVGDTFNIHNQYPQAEPNSVTIQRARAKSARQGQW